MIIQETAPGRKIILIHRNDSNVDLIEGYTIVHTDQGGGCFVLP